MLISRQLTPFSITSPRQPFSLVAVVRDEEAVGWHDSTVRKVLASQQADAVLKDLATQLEPDPVGGDHGYGA
jgi:hypothetical protein